MFKLDAETPVILSIRVRIMSNSSSPAQSSLASTTSISVTSTGTGLFALDDYSYSPSDFISTQERKDEALLVLKSNLLDALKKEVKSMDEESWKYEKPRTCIELMSRQGLKRWCFGRATFDGI